MRWCAVTIGKTCEPGVPEVLTWVELIRRVARAVGMDKWILPIPQSPKA